MLQWILDLEDSKSSIGACRVQILIVVTDTNAFDVLSVSLNFKETILSEWVHHNLDRTWLVGITDSSEEGVSIMEHLDLATVDVLGKFPFFFSIFDLSDGFVLSCGKYGCCLKDGQILRLLHFCRPEDTKASEVDVGESVGPDWVFLAILRVQTPHVDGRVESG